MYPLPFLSGSTYVKFSCLPVSPTIFQYLSLMFNLENTKLLSSIGARTTDLMIQGSTYSNCRILYRGAVIMVSSLTESISIPITVSAKDKFRIALYFLLLCSTIANGDNFRCNHSGVPRRRSISSR